MDADLTKYRDKLIGSEDERAVSPVIGVILMVAITVILAAVIAAFVLDMGDEMGEDTPQAQTAFEANSAWNLSDGEDTFVTMDHDGGDGYEMDEVTINVDLDGTETGDEFDEDIAGEVTLDANNGFSEGDIELDGYEDGDEFTVGDSYDFVHNADGESLDGDSEDYADFEDGTVEITVVHESSDGIITETELDLNEWTHYDDDD